MFSNEPDRQEQINSIENRLSRWKPAATAIDRDRLLFESGRAAGRAEAGIRAIQGSIVGSILAAIVTGGILMRERGLGRAVQSRPSRDESLQTAPPTIASANPDATAIGDVGERRVKISDDSYLALSRLAESNALERAPRPDPDETSIRSKANDDASRPTLNALSSPLDFKDL